MKTLGILNGKTIGYCDITQNGWSLNLPIDHYVGVLYSDNINAYYQAAVIEICSTIILGGCRNTISAGKSGLGLEFSSDMADMARLGDNPSETEWNDFCPSENYRNLKEAFFRAAFRAQPVLGENERNSRGDFKNVVIFDFDGTIEKDILELIELFSQRHVVSQRKAAFLKSRKTKKNLDEFR